ncbi:hypothetical protein D3C80_1134690 [compost metagenome]
MAFGGVATGSMKAQEAPTAISTDTTMGETPSASATPANSGTSRAAVAVLETSSVRNTTKAARQSSMMKMGMVESALERCSARKALAPVCLRMALKVRPPPNSSSTPQSVFWLMSSQLATRLTAMARMAPMAIRVSNWGMPPSAAARGWEPIHSSTVVRKMSKVVLRWPVHSMVTCSVLTWCDRLGRVTQ